MIGPCDFPGCGRPGEHYGPPWDSTRCEHHPPQDDLDGWSVNEDEYAAEQNAAEEAQRGPSRGLVTIRLGPWSRRLL